VTGWLTWEDSNFHIPVSKNAFEMSAEFPLFWLKSRTWRLLQLQVVNVTKRATVKTSRVSPLNIG
jgi:hypothetical protein